MAALSLSELDKLDTSTYQTIYISVGSKNNETPPNEFFQDFPFFLTFAKLPMLCISIDMYKEFTQMERPFVTLPDDTKATCTYITVPSFSLDETFSITARLVEKLKLNHSRVFFVNFIKYIHPNAGDVRHATQAMKLRQIVEPYDYYDWCGYRLPHFILKNPETPTPMLTNVQTYIDSLFTLFKPREKEDFISSFSDGEKLKQFLKLKHSRTSVEERIQLYKALRSCLFDITPNTLWCSSQIKSLLNMPEDWIEEYPENEFGGKRTKRKRKKRTKRL